MQAQTITTKLGANAALRYAAIAVGWLFVSVLLSIPGNAPLNPAATIEIRTDIAAASLLLILYGWRFLPVGVAIIVIESLLVPKVGSDGLFVLTNTVASSAVVSAVAYLMGGIDRKESWGSQRDFAVFASCAIFLPLVIAGAQLPFLSQSGPTHPFFLEWIAGVAPLAAILPAGIKLAEWARAADRESFFDYLRQKSPPGLLLAQLVFLLLAAAYMWIERLVGGNGRMFPLLIGVFWVALTSGLTAAAVAFLLAEILLVCTNYYTKTNSPIFDLHLAAALMGLGAVAAGALYTARRSAEGKLREQGEALERQLAEMQVIRRLADSIIALREEDALYQLGAEAIGEQLQAEQVWLLWIPADGEEAQERGFWSSSRHTGRDTFAPHFTDETLTPIWHFLAQSRTQLFSRADLPNKRLVEGKQDVLLHQACGIKSLLLHPFSFDSAGFYVAAILSYERFRQWWGGDVQFLTAVADQITIALQKTRLLGEREERSRAFAKMSQALVAETGDSFFRNLVLRLAETTGTRGAYATQVDLDKREATMLAFADSGRVRKEFAFLIEGTPIEVTLEKGSLAIDDKAAEQFPTFEQLTSVEMRGFASTRLLDSHGAPLGTLAIYDDKPLKDSDHIATVLRLFAARASAEVERSERERMLRESEASYRRLLETAHEGIWIVDAAGKTTFVNATMAATLGYAAEDLLEKNLQEFVSDEDRERVGIELQRELAGTAAQQDFRFKRRDGSLIWTMLSMSPIRDDEGEFQGALAMVTDISGRKRNEQELDRLVHDRTAELLASNRELEAFCYSISHDLRQPLRAIDGFSRAVVEDLGDDVPEDVRDHLHRVRRAANRMSELIDALLTLSRLSRIEMSKETVDLSATANAILQDLAKTDTDRAKAFAVREGLTTVGDARLLHIALENLLNNAWKFSSRSEKPFVEFGAKKVGGQTCFFVKDNGIGFDMAYQSKLFKPFERLHSDAEFYGTGIGLATVARVIERHGGKIWAEGHEGKGATFYFTV